MTNTMELYCERCEKDTNELMEYQGDTLCKECVLEKQNEEYYFGLTESLLESIDSLKSDLKTFESELIRREQSAHELTKEEHNESMREEIDSLDNSVIWFLEEYLRVRKTVGYDKSMILNLSEIRYKCDKLLTIVGKTEQ